VAGGLLVCVVADGEPLLELRRRIARERPDAVASGLAIARAAAGAKRVIVVVREDWADAARALGRALSPDLAEIVRVRAVVGCDDARTLGLAAPGETMVALPVEQIALGGAPGVEIAGAVALPGVYPAGATLEAMVARAGGATAPAWVAFDGGAAAGRLTYPDEQIDQRTRALVVLPVEHGVVRRALLSVADSRRRAAATCSSCGICTAVCPRALAGAPLSPHRQLGAADCSGCGLCDAICPVGLSPRALLGGVAATAAWAPAHPDRAARGVAIARFTEMLDLSRYDRAQA
jgi:Na+-translocating ferredoxin:NAD+ oxidoreductase RnfC subunit